jgi:Rieske Fe-S protein
MMATGLTVALGGCSDVGIAPETDDESIMVDGTRITLRLDRLGALRSIGDAYVIGAQSTIVLRTGTREYRAFTNVCTHSGCGIFLFERDRMRCQCHGSEFDVEGRNVAGPAPLPLARYTTELDEQGTTLRITRPG